MEIFNRYLTLTTNVAVLIGLALLVYELKQNNNGLFVTNQWALTEIAMMPRQAILENEDMAIIMLKVNKKEELSELQAIRYTAYVQQYTEWLVTSYTLYKEGLMPAQDWQGILIEVRRIANTNEIAMQAVLGFTLTDELREMILDNTKT